MELRQLRFVLTLAEERHFGRAAARMHISQPTLSQEIQRLERELGVALFSRNSRGVLLTPIGETVLTLAKNTLAAADLLTETARAASRGEAGRLSVGFTPTTAPAFLPELLRLYREQHPAVTIDLYASALAEPSAGLATDRVDVALIWPPVSVPGLGQRRLLAEQRFVLLAADHPLAARERLQFAEIADLPVCVIESDDRAWLDFWLAADLRGGRPARRGPVATSYDGALAAVAAGEAIAFVPAGAKAFASGAPVVATAVDALPDAVLAVAWPLHRHNPLTEGFVSLAVDLARSVTA